MPIVGRVCFAAVLMSVSSQTLPPVGPAAINEQDLWGIHDLLIVGFACPACLKPDLTVAREKVQQSAVDFAKLLHVVHPVKKCRDAFKQVTLVSNQTFIDEMADKSLSCLTPAVQCSSSSTVFCTVANFRQMMNTRYKDFDSKTPGSPLAPLAMACNKDNTYWSRACSYWVSFHAMGLRADVTNSGYKLLTSLAPMIAGGALLCQGCTRHYILFVKPFLKSQPTLMNFLNYLMPRKGLSPEVPCFPQCGKASAHVDELVVVPANPTGEFIRLKAFQKIVETVVSTGTLPVPLTAILSIHHDLVSEGVAEQFMKNKKSFCSPSQACRLLKQSPVIKADPQSMSFGCTALNTLQLSTSFEKLWTAIDAKCVAGYTGTTLGTYTPGTVPGTAPNPCTTMAPPTTTPCPTTVPITCASLVCPQPMVMKPNPTSMACKPFSGGCSVGYCCVMPTTTPAPTSPPQPTTTPCHTTTPSPTTTPAPTTAPRTCKSFYCPAGYMTIAKPASVMCTSSYGCSVATCCLIITTPPLPVTTTPCPTTTPIPTTVPLTCASHVCPKPMVIKPSPENIICDGMGNLCSDAGCCLMPTTTPAPTTTPQPTTTPCPTTTPSPTTTPAPTTSLYTCKSFYCPTPFVSMLKPETAVCTGPSGCSIKFCCLMVTTTPVPSTTPAPTTTPCPTTTPPLPTTTPAPTTTPCPTAPPTNAPAPCSTAAIRLYSSKQGVVMNADGGAKSWAMPVMGMFALLAVGGVAAGVGASVFRRGRRYTRFPSVFSTLEEGVRGPLE